MSDFKVTMVCSEFLRPDWVASKLSEHGVVFLDRPCETGDEVVECAGDADVICVCGGSHLVSDQAVRQLPKCRVILRVGAGVDNIPVDEATKLGIVVANTPEATMRPVAEHAIGLLLAVVRYIGQQNHLIHEGHWDENGRQIRQRWPLLEDGTLGLIGFGRIARMVVKKLSGFDMTILAADPLVDPAMMTECGVEPVNMEDLLRRSDYVSLHTPLSQQTRHLISEREFRLMKPAAVFINTSRGPVVDEGALISALQNGWIAGAGLDVLVAEPPDPKNLLLKMENVVLTPHIASIHKCWEDEFWQHSVRTIIEMAKGKMPIWVVNPQVKPRWEPVA